MADVDVPMERARLMRVARTLHEEIDRALRVEMYGTPANGGEIAFKMRPVEDGIEMDYAMPLAWLPDGAKHELVRVTVRTLETF